MPQEIVLSVGVNGVNLLPDVITVTNLLNVVPEKEGGPGAKLIVPKDDGSFVSTAGPDVITAIKAFQKKQFGWSDGFVDKGGATIYRLNKLAASVAQNQSAMPGDMRARIIEAARNEKGIVSDAGQQVYTGKRQGWERLKQYFDESLITPMNWGSKGKFKYEDGKEYELTALQGIQKAHMRAPQDKEGRGMQWCGIFANWVWLQCGTNTKWKLGTGGGPTPENAKPVPISTDLKQILPGDIVVNSGNLVHHYLCVEISSNGKTFYTIDGNSTNQEVRETKHELSQMAGFYALDTVYNRNKTFPPQKG